MTIETDRQRAARKLSKLSAQQGQAETDGVVTRSEIDATEHARRVDAEYHREKARRDARRRLADEERGPQDAPELLTLRERLARPQSPVQSRIDGWQPRGTRIILAAQHKSGKTIATQNLIRSLVDGDPWLDKYPVTPVDGTVALLDFEMNDIQLDGWFRDQRITRDDKVIAVLKELVPCGSCARRLDGDVAKLAGLRLGKHERRILLAAPPPDREPIVVSAERAGRSAAEAHRRAVRRLAMAGLIDTRKKPVEIETKAVALVVGEPLLPNTAGRPRETTVSLPSGGANTPGADGRAASHLDSRERRSDSVGGTSAHVGWADSGVAFCLDPALSCEGQEVRRGL